MLLKGGSAVLATSAISYVAVATAGFLNSLCMRMGELNTGIKIYDEEGNEIGISQVCAKKAVYNTAFSRILLSLPTFCIPGVTMFLLDKMGMIPKAKAPKTILEIAVVSLALYTALPLSVSLFP